MHKKKVAYVAGIMDEWRHLALFEHLKDFEVEVHAISKNSLLNHYRSNLKLFLYENVQDMPGYMRGLEEKILDASLIISREVSRLSTFQATRIAQKYDVPSLVMVSETRPNFYKDYANIMAIQNDILRASSGFIAMSKHADAMLDFYNVPKNIKTIMNPTLPSFVPDDVAVRRRRFRDRASLGENELVLGVFGDLDKSFRGDTLFGAIKMLKARDPYNGSKIRLLVIGDGSNAQKLKYMAFEMGIGNQVSFIHEDTNLYYFDLLSALDLVLHLEPIADQLEHHEQFPRYLLDAVATKSSALVKTGSVAKELLGENCYIFEEETEYHISNLLQYCIDNREKLQTQKMEFAQNIIDLYSCQSSRAIINNIIDTMIKDAGSSSFSERFAKLKSEIEVQVSRADYGQSLVLIEEGLLNFENQGKYLSQLLQHKGNILMSMNRSDEAIEAFAKSIDYDGKNASVYIALGLISFHGHSFSDAITFYKKAIGLSPENVEAMIGLGMSYFRNSMHNEAMYWLKKAVLKEGGDGRALTALIQAATDCPKPDLGVSALENVLEAAGECNRLLLALGRMYMKTGQSDKGHILVKKALAAEPGAA